MTRRGQITDFYEIEFPRPQCPRCGLPPHLYNLRSDQSVALIFDRPLMSPARTTDMKPPSSPIDRYAEWCRSRLTEWARGKKLATFERLFTMLDQTGISKKPITLENMFDTCYVTEAVKCCGIAHNKAQEHDSEQQEKLRREIGLLSNLRLAVTFGDLAKNALENAVLAPDRVSPRDAYTHLPKDSDYHSPSAEIHGVVFKALLQSHPFYLLTLTLPPPGRTTPLRESYFAYLEQGLKVLKSTG